ncbi:MAG: sigma-70 family RNA polymerase sigma factor, partial [Lentisphaeria bacterium]|nr:sigma-70 family RNA polymerase sigma factor [Lentisphaeria bacterium]
MSLDFDSAFAKEVYGIIEKIGPESANAAALDFAGKHHYPQDGRSVSIDKTSTTLMGDVLAETKDTPAEELREMRKSREEAFQDFCYIYGGYIAYKLQMKWENSGFGDIFEKEEYLSLAIRQVVEALVRSLQRNGYKKGTFHHLVNTAICNKARDVTDKVATWRRDHRGDISVESCEDILNGKIEISLESSLVAADPGAEEEKEMDTASIMEIARMLGRRSKSNDYEMFLMYYVKGLNYTDIAEEYGKSVSTVSNRIRIF